MSGNTAVRRFNTRQRAALFLAQDGKCAKCGDPLEPGWHADHEQPWSRGGVTDVVNGQALCPTCNLKKGAQVERQSESTSQTTRTPRQWQEDAWRKYEQVNAPDFLCCSCPAAGKTDWALGVARRLLDRGTVERVVIVAPSQNVRDQWIDQKLVSLTWVENKDGAVEDRRDFEGIALTYAQVAMNPDLQRRACQRRRTLVIFDEVHHAGDEQSWGDSVTHAFELATRRIGLTGTPWRRPKGGRIPFVTYVEDKHNPQMGRVVPDYDYPYGRAVADRVCRYIQFHAYDARVVSVELELATSHSMALSDLSDQQDRSQAISIILDTTREWMRTVLHLAHGDLMAIRTGSSEDGAVPDALGLVIADDQQHARDIARLLERIAGEVPELIISDEPDAEEALKRFRRGSRKWAVAVNKVSEGVNVVPLYVGVYATRKVSPLLFRQIVGRFVRRRPNEDRDAILYLPAVPDLMSHASEIEMELLHEVELEVVAVEREAQRPRERKPTDPDLRIWNVDNATLHGVIRSGEDFAREEYEEARALCEKHEAHIDPLKLIAILREHGVHLGKPAPTATAAPSAEPLPEQRTISKDQQKRYLRGKLDKLVKRKAFEMGIEVSDLNLALARKYGLRPTMSIAQLREAIEFVSALSEEDASL